MSTTPRGDRRRAEILAAATALFARHGYRGTSLAAVATAVGLTEAGLLHHFPSKAELLLAVLEERDRRDADDIETRFDRDGLGLFVSLESLVDHNAGSPELVRLFTILVAEAAAFDTHPARAHFAERYRTITARVRGHLERGMAAGEIAEDVDCELVARLLLAMMDGLQVQWLLDPDFDMPTAFRVFSATMANAVAAARA